MQEIEKKKVPKDMTAIHKKFEEKKQEELQRVEERFDALLKEAGNKDKEEPAPNGKMEEKGANDEP